MSTILKRAAAMYDANHWLHPDLRYELRQPGKSGSRLHATLTYNDQAKEWAVKTTTAEQRLFLTEAEAVGWLSSWAEVHGGTVQRVACSCHRCAGDQEFMEMVKHLTGISHGACDEHRADLIRLVEEIKEGRAA